MPDILIATDPGPFDWFAFVGIPLLAIVIAAFLAIVGIVASAVTAGAAIWIALGAEKRARGESARRAREQFAIAFMNYVNAPSEKTALQSYRAGAMTDDPAKDAILGWFQEQEAAMGGQRSTVAFATELRLFKWVESGVFDDSDIVQDGGSFMKLS